jgi:hypothetical protein
MSKRLIKLTESDLHKIIKKSVNRVINESDTGNFDDYYSGDDPYYSLNGMLKGEVISPEWKKSAKKVIFDLGRKVATGDYDFNKEEQVRKKILGMAYDAMENAGMSWQFFEDFEGELRRAHDLGLKNMRIHDRLYENIKLTERDLHNVIKESVYRILNEVKWTDSYGEEHSSHGYYSPEEGGMQKANNEWGKLADEREKRMFNNDPNVGTMVGKMDSKDILKHARNGVDFSQLTDDDRIDTSGRIHKDMNNMTPEQWRQWTKDASARARNWANYHATNPDPQLPWDKKEDFRRENLKKARNWNDYRNRGFNSALRTWNS